MFENSQPSEADTQKVLFVCVGCGNAIHEDPDSWFAAPDWQAVQHAPGCLTHAESDLRALREGYLASAKYADGCWSALNYHKDAERVQTIADLIATLQTSPSTDLATQVEAALGEFHDSLVSGLRAARDGHSKASFSNDITRIQGLRDLLAASVPPS